jgi:flavin reductase (DIM6/NTAB) family NADH-FMN oxidoreductase RutF
MEINPKSLSQKEAYTILIGSVVPRPIALVSTVNRDGIKNLAPFSYFTIASSNPMMLAFFPQRSAAKGGFKDTAKNIINTGEYVINVVTEANVEKANITSGLFDESVDEFEKSGLTAVPASVVHGFRVKESPISFECKLSHHLALGDPLNGADTIIGEVLMVHVDDALIDNYRIDLRKLGPVSRLAGNFYGKVGEDFEIERPSV